MWRPLAGSRKAVAPRRGQSARSLLGEATFAQRHEVFKSSALQCTHSL